MDVLRRIFKSTFEGLYHLMKQFMQFFREMPNPVKIVFLLYFLQGVWHNFGHPVTPRLVTDMQISEYYFGFYFAAMSFGLLVGAPIWGVLGDRGNKRTYIVLGLLVYSFGQYMFAFVGDKDWMILFRFISGFGVSASITLLLSHLIEYTDHKHRKVYLGLYQALFVLGSSVGYYIGGHLTDVKLFIDWFHTNDLRNVFLVQAIINLFHATAIFFLIKDRKVAHHEESDKGILAGFKALKTLDLNFFIFLISLTLISLGAINVSKYIEVFMNDQGYTPADIGKFVGATGIVSILATIIIVPIVSKLNRDFTFMIFIQLFSAVIIFIVFRSTELLIMLYSVFMIYVVLKAVYTPLEQHFISSYAEEGQYGRIMGVRQAFYSIGLVVGPLIGGYLYYIQPEYVFDISALMFLLGLFLLLVIGRNIKRKKVHLNE